MSALLIAQAVVMGVLEGVTEFLPVSSTGHLIIAGELMGFLATGKREVFEISIQLGAILAVCWEYRERLRNVVMTLGQPSSQKFTLNIIIAFLPAGIAGFILVNHIKQYLFHPVPVAFALILGGILILWAERRKHSVTVQSVEQLQWRDALKIGLAQSLALMPGVSRSGATIIGGLFFGLSRQAATEFSFFLAIPVMFAATGFDFYRHSALLSMNDSLVFFTGFACAFISALLTVRALIRYVQQHSFLPFAWYRIVLGSLILLATWTEVVRWDIG